MRGLSQRFLDDLGGGILGPIRNRVVADGSLCLEIRDESVNIYYRGGNLLRLSPSSGGYNAFFDMASYAKGADGILFDSPPPGEINCTGDVARWLEAFPMLKLAIDLYQGRKAADEREAQQQIVRDNNFGGVSPATDYYICDIEYQFSESRFDLVAARWPSTSPRRKKQDNCRLVIAEAKFGDDAISGKSGIHSHIVDINQFLGNTDNLRSLKAEMITVFNQKRALGLIECKKDLVAFTDERPMLLLLLANHDPAKSMLRTALKSLPDSPHADLYLATGCFMGYGLFDQAVLPLDEAISRFESYVFSRRLMR